MTASSLSGKTIFITGASRGIGKAIALRAAADGARIGVVGKTDEPHPKLPGTVHTTVEEIQTVGGKAVGCIADIRDEQQVEDAIQRTADTFGGIDILVNNASAIFLAGTDETPMKRFDLMHSVNVRGTFMTSQKCLPYLKEAHDAQILNIAPPLNFESRWFAPHVAYSISKFGMSLCVLGMAEELRGWNIAVNALWPKTVIATAAVRNLLGGEEVANRSRHPEIMADAAYLILTGQMQPATGQYFIDEDVLRDHGVTDFTGYAVTPGEEPLPDFFV